jgi:hypothetical protein
MIQRKKRNTRRRKPTAKERAIFDAVVSDINEDMRNHYLAEMMYEYPEWTYSVIRKEIAKVTGPKPAPTRRTTPTFDDSADVARVRTNLFNVIAELSE